jgi:carboxyl-terminal processing protease
MMFERHRETVEGRSERHTMIRQWLAGILRLQVPIWLVVPLLALTLVLGLGGGYLAALRLTSPCPLSADVCAGFANFWQTWKLVSEQYVDPQAVDPKRMTVGAIEGMLDTLGDRGHTRYLPPEAAQAEQEWLSGRFEGIGAYIDVRDDQPIIVQPIEGSPAERAGLRPGDRILKVNGESVQGITIEELKNKVRGPKGTTVTLTITHEGEELPIDVTVTREEINVPNVSWRMLPNKVAFIHLLQFASRSSEELKQALTEAQAQGAQAVVLDLRNNPGGLVDELIGAASQFLPPDTTVLLEADRAGNRTPYKTREGGVAQDIPLVVLVNNNTASSAEILAGALKETGRARVIGVPTFGTATVLRTFNLEGGAQLRLGTTQWLTPGGKQVRGEGIQPDELVALPPGAAPLSPSEAAKLDLPALLTSQDTQLARALERAQEIARK